MTQPAGNAAQRKPTIIDIAREAGVSISTVSRVLNKTLPVAEETSRRVWEAIERLEFSPNAAARSLASKRTNAIGLLLPGISGAFFPPMLAGIERCTTENSFDLLIYSSPELEIPGRRHRLPVGEHNTDGLLVFTNSMDDDEIARLHHRGLPIVLLHRSSPPDLDIPSVTFENKSGSEKLVDHLIEVHDCRRIAFLAGPAGNEDSYWREKGYRTSLEKHNIPYDPSLVSVGEFEGRVAGPATRRMLDSGIRPDAIFTGDDEAAAGVVTELIVMGVRIPEDIAVVGFDDDYLATYLPVPLTTVRAPIEGAGYEAARQLVSLIRTGTADPFIILPTELIIRRSCGCIPDTKK